MLPCPGYYKQCCDEHWGTCVSFNSGFLSVKGNLLLLRSSFLFLPWPELCLTGPALAARVAVMLQGSSRRIGSARVTFAPCLFQPRSTPFSQNRLRHTCMYHFLFCLMFNLYLDSIETLQSDLTLELSVTAAPHATGGVLLGSPCTSVSPPGP